MPNKSFDQEFYFKLRDEMQQAVQRRFQFQLAKVTSLGTLIGVGSLLIKNFDLNVFFYVIPYIAFSFDLLIFSESFTLRRLSTYLHEEKKSSQDAEHRWEIFVRDNPGKFASIASLLFTTATLLGCVIILIFTSNIKEWFENYYNIVWLISIIGMLVLHKYLDTQPRSREWFFRWKMK